jgi:hypothetical protein
VTPAKGTRYRKVNAPSRYWCVFAASYGEPPEHQMVNSITIAKLTHPTCFSFVLSSLTLCVPFPSFALFVVQALSSVTISLQ